MATTRSKFKSQMKTNVGTTQVLLVDETGTNKSIQIKCSPYTHISKFYPIFQKLYEDTNINKNAPLPEKIVYKYKGSVVCGTIIEIGIEDGHTVFVEYK
jgi:hypothetical protein